MVERHRRAGRRSGECGAWHASSPAKTARKGTAATCRGEAKRHVPLGQEILQLPLATVGGARRARRRKRPPRLTLATSTMPAGPAILAEIGQQMAGQAAPASA